MRALRRAQLEPSSLVAMRHSAGRYDIGVRFVPSQSVVIQDKALLDRAIANRALAFEMGVVGVDLMAPEQRGDDLAVLPLENLSPDSDDDFFADGMTDALITTLATMQMVRGFGYMLEDYK